MAKILLVDDDKDIIEILTQILEFEKYAVSSAADGEEALAKIEKERPDLIVTDVMLPKMDGWRLCGKVKENPLLKHIPVLIMTARTNDVNELRAQEGGGDAHITKPFQNQDFLKTVQKLLDKKF